MDKDKLQEILELHQKWFDGEEGGERANLWDADLRGANLHAVYSKPRTSWDTKGIAGFAVAHPEILAFQKIGNPSVRIQAVR